MTFRALSVAHIILSLNGKLFLDIALQIRSGMFDVTLAIRSVLLQFFVHTRAGQTATGFNRRFSPALRQ